MCIDRKGIEIVSGHHRVRAARQAEIYEIFVILDVTGLSRDRIKAKQLAHNSIDGYDNEELVKRIFDSIEDAASKIEAFVPANIVEEFKRISVSDVNVEMDIQQIQLMFFKYEKACFEKLANYLEEKDEVYAAELKEFEKVKKAIRETGKEYNIRAVGTIMARLCELCLARYEGANVEHKYIADCMKSTLLTTEQADKLTALLKNKGKDETQIDYILRKLSE